MCLCSKITKLKKDEIDQFGFWEIHIFICISLSDPITSYVRNDKKFEIKKQA